MISDSIAQCCLICFDDSPGLTWSCHPFAPNLESAHIYHAFCLNSWFASSNNTKCPSCRVEVTPLELPSEDHKISKIAKDAGIYSMSKEKRVIEITKALSYENLALVSLLIEEKNLLPWQLKENIMVLAAKKNRFDLIKRLNFPEQPLSPYCHKKCLTIALKNQNFEVFNYLLALDIEIEDSFRCKIAEDLAIGSFWNIIPYVLPMRTNIDFSSKSAIIRCAIDAEPPRSDIIFYLLNSFPDEQNQVRGNAVRYATEKNLIKLLEKLLPPTQEISSWHRGISALQAVENKNWELLYFFLSEGKNISHFHKICIIDEAFKAGKYEVIDHVLSYSIDLFGKARGVAIIEAAKKDLWDVVKHLCKTEQVMPIEIKGRAALLATRQNHLDVLKCLIKKNHEISDDYVGRIILEAVKLDAVPIVKFIFSKGFFLTLYWRSEAVITAAMLGHFSFVNYFLHNNHPISELARYTAAFFATAKNALSVLHRVLPDGTPFPLNLILPKKLKVSKEIKGQAVLNAAIYNRLDIIKFCFFNLGAIKEEDREKSIQHAVGHENLEMLKYLMSFGPISDRYKRRILQEAIEFEYQEIIDFLSED